MAILASNSYSITNVNDGKTPYLHIAYANSADGITDFSTSNSGNKRYLGTYTDYTQAYSTDPTKYKWVDMVGTVKIDGVNKYVECRSQSGYILLNETKDDLKLGQAGSSTRDKTSDFIVIEPSSPIYIQTFVTTPAGNEGYWTAYRFYDSDKNPLGNRVVYADNVGNKYTHTKISVISPSYAKYLRVSQSTFGNGLFMIEEATVPSDYSPAPEDTQADIDSKADQGFTTQQLNELRERQQLQQKELEAKALQDDLEKWYQEYLNYVTLDTKDKQKSEQDLLALSERIVGINNDLGGTKERWSFLDNYMEAGNEGLVVGKKDGTANIKVSDDRISMFSNGSEVMWITQNMLHIDNGVFTKTLQIGKYRFEEYGDNSEFLVIRYLGGN